MITYPLCGEFEPTFLVWDLKSAGGRCSVVVWGERQPLRHRTDGRGHQSCRVLPCNPLFWRGVIQSLPWGTGAFKNLFFVTQGIETRAAPVIEYRVFKTCTFVAQGSNVNLGQPQVGTRSNLSHSAPRARPSLEEAAMAASTSSRIAGAAACARQDGGGRRGGSWRPAHPRAECVRFRCAWRGFS